MNSAPLPQDDSIEKRNRRVGVIVAGVVFGMLGLSFAAVPLYDLFCRTTGFDGRTMVATSAPRVLGKKTYTVRFDANIIPGIQWTFEPELSAVDVVPGQVKTINYRIRNIGPIESTAIASFNVLPETTGAHFNKLQCFCFTEQTLAPGEMREEPVVFFIDPAIEADGDNDHVQTITLSYTLFPAKTATKPLAATDSKVGVPTR